MDPDRGPVFVGPAVITFHEKARFLTDTAKDYLWDIQSDRPRQGHTEHLVGGQTRETDRLGFEDVGTRGTAQGKAYGVIINNDRQFILGAGQGEPESIPARQQGPAR